MQGDFLHQLLLPCNSLVDCRFPADAEELRRKENDQALQEEAAEQKSLQGPVSSLCLVHK